MDNLQYLKSLEFLTAGILSSFKPYYKWITFNTNGDNGVSRFLNKF